MKFIDEEKIENKKVILRCDFNVPIENGKVLDDIICLIITAH